MENFVASGWAQITLGSDIDPNMRNKGSKRSAIDHEQAHVNNFKQYLENVDKLASPLFDGEWACCDCIEAKYEYFTLADKYYKTRLEEKDTELECEDYPENSDERAIQCKLLPKKTHEREVAFTELNKAYKRMLALCY